MENAQLFRLTTIFLFMVLAAIGLYFRIKASNSQDQISQREEGLPVMILLRIFGFLTWLSLLLYMIRPAWMDWAAVSFPAWARWIGAAIVAVAIPLMYWMFRSIGRNVTDTVSIRATHRLVTHGPYQYVRHPMYSISFLMFCGFTLITANAFIGLMGLLSLIFLRIRTPAEETKLIEAFGDEYRAYMRRTPRFLPRLSHSPFD